MKRITLAITLLVLGACNNHSNTPKTQVSTSNTTSPVAPIEEADEEIDKDVDSTPPSCLNDIRFGDWTEEDWYDNDYFRTLRKYFNACYDGEIENEVLAPYKSVLKSQFAIENASPFIAGGMFVSIVFLDAPNTRFTTWIYSDVDESIGVVVDYEVRGFTVKDERPHWTKEAILKIIKEHPENKLW